MTIFDYSTVEWCRNPDTWDGLCMKCEECGRKFDEHGVMIDKHSAMFDKDKEDEDD